MRPEPPDHYATLGIPATATPGQITHAYRVLARGLHPDTSDVPGETRSRFTAVTAAYRILHDPARRAAYDRARQSASPAPPPAASQSPAAVHVNVLLAPADAISTIPSAPHSAPQPLLRAGPTRISPLPHRGS